MQSALVGEPHLSTLEQISPQAYIRFILCFGIPPYSTHYEAIQILRQGLKATAAEVPILNSLVVSVVDSKGRETKDVRHKDVAMLSIKDLTNSGLDFEKIRSEGFPSHVFDGEMLCSTGVFAAPGGDVSSAS